MAAAGGAHRAPPGSAVSAPPPEHPRAAAGAQEGARPPAFVAFFIGRPIFATVVAILITVAGAISIPLLPVAQFPPIVPPTVQVSATYTGASADVVERTLTLPLEEQVNGAEGMLYMASTSANDGQVSLTVTFELGRDPDIAAVNVNNRVAVAEPRLPEDVRRLGITVRKQAPDLTLVVNLVSPDGSRDALFLSNYALINVLDSLKRVPGVGEINMFGERRYAMRIWLDAERLAKLELTAADVIAAVRDQNAQIAAGRAGAPPAPEGQQLEIPLVTKGRLQTVEEFEQIVVRADADGSLLRLRDVARVELGAQSYNGFTRLTGQPTVTMGVFQLPDANALEVSAAVRAELARLAERFPSGVSWAVRYDPTRFVAESIAEVLRALAEAMALVFLVVYLFLQDWRTTIIPAVTIPVSLIGTFAVLNAIGLSINTITLFALVLAIGLVVDDAIVVVENVARLLSGGLPRREAVARSMGEVSSAIVAATLVLGAVFVPVAFLPGTTGRLLREFGLAVSCAVGISLLNALTLSPALCALWMRPERERKARFFAAFDRGFAAVVRRYDASVRALFPRRGMVLLAYAALGAATLLLFRSVPTGFIPEEDQGYFITSFQLPDGASLERTLEVAKRVEGILLGTPGIVGTNLFGGFDALTGTFPSNVGTVFVSLAPWDERGAEGRSLEAILGEVRPALSAIPGARILALNPAPIRGLSRTGGFEFQLQDRGGGELSELAATAQRVIDEGNRSPELRNLFSSFRPTVPQVLVDIDRSKAKALGVPVSDVLETLQVFMGGLYVNDFDRFGRLFRVFAQAEGELRARPEDVGRLWVRSERGEMVPVSTLVRLERRVGARDIPHYNVYRSAKIQGEAAPGYSSGQALTRMEAIARSVPARVDVFRVDRHGLPGEAGGERGGGDPRPLAAGGVPVPRGTVRELEPPLRHHAGGAAGVPRRPRRPGAAEPRERPLLPDRPGDADRPRQQELDPDRRVREATAGAGGEPRGRRPRGRRAALPAGGHDGVLVHPRRRAPRRRHRRGSRRAPLPRHGGLRRHARGHAAEPRAGAGAVRHRAGLGRVARQAPAPRSRERRASMTHPRSRLASLAAAAALAAALGCGPGEGPAAPPPPEVGVVAARLGSVPDRREYVGNVRAVTEIDVRARVRGYLIEKRFSEGQQVAAGRRAVPDRPEQLRAGPRRGQGPARPDARGAEAARRPSSRAPRSSAGTTSSASRVLDARREALDAAAAEVAERRGERGDGGQLDLSWCTVHAPGAGRIGLALVDVGNLVGESGQDTVLARIVQVDPIHVYFAPTELERLEVLQGAREGRIPAQREGNIRIELRARRRHALPAPGSRSTSWRRPSTRRAAR